MDARRDPNQDSWQEQAAKRLHRMPLVPVALLMMLGIGISVWVGQRSPWTSFLPALLLAILAVVSIVRGHKRTASVCGWLVLLSIGATGYTVQRGPDTDDLGRIATTEYRPLVFKAEILSGAVWRPNSFYRDGSAENERWQTQWRVACHAVRDGGQWRDCQAISSLSVTGRVEQLLPGDIVLVYGSCAAIAPPSNPGEADLREHFRNEHQFVYLRSESIDQIVLERSTWRRPFARATAMMVGRIDRAIHRYVPLGQAPLAAALVFGQRQQVDWEAQQKLLSTGTLHMLAISGMHIELVAGALWIACWLIGLRQRQSLLVVGSVVILYALIAGANPPVLRAVFIVLAVCVARWQGRRSDLANLLAFSALALLVMRSSWVANVGVQLSYLAVATIAIFARGVTGRGARADALAAVIEESWSWQRRLFRKLANWSWQMVALSFWIWLITAPLIWSNFHVVSLVSIPLNVLMWPFLVVGLLSGLVLAVGWWLPPLAWLLGLMCGVSLWCISGLVWMGDWLRMGHVWMPAPTVAWLISFYTIVLVGLFAMQWRPVVRPWLGVALTLWLLIGASPWLMGPRGHAPDWLRASSPPISAQPALSQPNNHLAKTFLQPLSLTAADSIDDHSTAAQPQAADDSSSVPMHRNRHSELRLTFIDVGHGTSVLIEMPGGEVWLYDAGHLGNGERSHEPIARVLWNVPTARIDRILVSHADADHYNALPGLAERFSIGQVIASPHFWQHPADELGQLRSHLANSGIAMERMVQGEQIACGEVEIRALHPPGDWSDSVDNGNSLTLEIRYAGRSVLLPGDLEKGGLAKLLAQPPRDCDLLMAPHHGSMTHDPTQLIRWCKPEWIMISGGPRAARAKVIERYTQPGNQTAVTHQSGALQARIFGSGELNVRHWNVTGWQTLPTTAEIDRVGQAVTRPSSL